MIPPKRRCECGQRLYVQSTKPSGAGRIIYLVCRACGRRKKEIESEFLDLRNEGSVCRRCGCRMPLSQEITHEHV